MSRPPLRKSSSPARRRPAATFRCPACDEPLRVRGAQPGRAFECPSCGAGLLIHRGDEGEVTVRTVGGPTERPMPKWPFALAAAGLVCAIAAGWLVLRTGATPDPEPVAPDPPPIVAAPDPPPDVTANDEPPAVDAPPDPAPVEPSEDGPPDPEPVVPPVADVPEPEPEPVRPAVIAPRPDGDVNRRRLERRLDAPLASFSMPAPRPLREAMTDLEDLLRVRITIEDSGATPVQIDRPGPLTVREALDALAAAAGMAVEINADGVRFVPEA